MRLRVIPATSAEVPPIRLLDAARCCFVATATTRHPEVERGDEWENEEENDSDLKDGTDDSVEHPAKDHPDQQAGDQSAAGPSQTFS